MARTVFYFVARILMAAFFFELYNCASVFPFRPVFLSGDAWGPMFNRTAPGIRSIIECAGLCSTDLSCQSCLLIGADCHLGHPDMGSSFLSPQTQPATAHIREGKEISSQKWELKATTISITFYRVFRERHLLPCLGRCDQLWNLVKVHRHLLWLSCTAWSGHTLLPAMFGVPGRLQILRHRGDKVPFWTVPGNPDELYSFLWKQHRLWHLSSSRFDSSAEIVDQIMPSGQCFLFNFHQLCSRVWGQHTISCRTGRAQLGARISTGVFPIPTVWSATGIASLILTVLAILLWASPHLKTASWEILTLQFQP